MSFPIIQIKATNVDVEDTYIQQVNLKFNSLAKYVGEETDVTCEVEFEKETGNHHNSGKIHRVEANLFLAGKLYRAESSELNFELAIDEVRAELDKMLRRASDKKDTLIKRGGRKIKKILQFGR